MHSVTYAVEKLIVFPFIFCVLCCIFVKFQTSLNKQDDALVSTFEAETNETFFDAGSIINYRLYLFQNASGPSVNLSSLVIQLNSGNLELPDKTQYSVNISNNHSLPGNFKRLKNGSVQFTITGMVGGSDYIEIKFNASVPVSLEPLSLLQVGFTINSTTSNPVSYGPKYSDELYTTFPEIKLTRSPEGGKLQSVKVLNSFTFHKRNTKKSANKT